MHQHKLFKQRSNLDVGNQFYHKLACKGMEQSGIKICKVIEDVKRRFGKKSRLKVIVKHSMLCIFDVWAWHFSPFTDNVIPLRVAFPYLLLPTVSTIDIFYPILIFIRQLKVTILKLLFLNCVIINPWQGRINVRQARNVTGVGWRSDIAIHVVQIWNRELKLKNQRDAMLVIFGERRTLSLITFCK